MRPQVVELSDDDFEIVLPLSHLSLSNKEDEALARSLADEEEALYKDLLQTINSKSVRFCSNEAGHI